jgi:calcium-dependent protein kinase
MGNTAAKNGDRESSERALEEMSLTEREAITNLSEREAAAAWYRKGVAVTDVYDIIEVLGHGHMGEVFTARRKIAGHHNEHTRHNTAEDSPEIMTTIEGTHSRNKSSSSVGTDVSPGSSSSSSSNPKKNHRKSLSSMAHKAKKVVVKKSSSLGGDISSKLGGEISSKFNSKVDEDADSDLKPFIAADDNAPVVLHEPPKSPVRPVKSALKNTRHYSQDSSGAISALTTTTQSNSERMSTSSEATSIPSDYSSVPTVKSTETIESENKSVHFQRTFAVKTIMTSRINSAQVRELVNEIMIMRKLDHPYVLKLYEVYHVKRKLWLVTELCTGGDLSARKLNEHDAKNVIEQILRALVYLHRMSVVHRDIKLENVLYENNSKGATVRLIDFGLSKMFDRAGKATDYTRTPYTMSPETAKLYLASKDGEDSDEEITDKTDVWAVGIITFVMLSGEFPFIRTTADLKDDILMKKLTQADLHFGCTWKGRGITMEAREFIKGCLKGNPSERWTAKQALEFVQKTWGPTTDKIFEEWERQMALRRKPEYVPSPPDVDDDDDDDDIPSHTEWMDPENDLDIVPSVEECNRRAKKIVNHVAKVVRVKKAEIPEEEMDNVEINVDDVERYTQFGLLKKTILITMANTMDRSDVGKLRKIFIDADTENTGTITLQELISSIRKVSPDIDEGRAKVVFSGIDRDKSGHIHYAEFLAALAESHGLITLDRLSEAFDRIDTDGKGFITHDDLKTILGKDYDKDTVDRMIEEGDFKKNNKIDYDELLQLMFSDPAKGAQLAGSIPAVVKAPNQKMLSNLSSDEE